VKISCIIGIPLGIYPRKSLKFDLDGHASG
jgi:hypothetical protein